MNNKNRVLITKLNIMNFLKTGMSALLCVGLMVSCTKKDDPIDSASGIADLSFTIEASGLGNIVSVTPSATGASSFSVDFGTDATDDVLATVGPKVSYTYPSVAATYDITVTASATGADDAVLTKSYTVAVEASDIVGRWQLLHEAGALAVGPNLENVTSWWSNDLAAVKTRDCFFDDVYEFNADQSFNNIVGDATWLEKSWESVPEETCGTALAPFDGSNKNATWSHDPEAGTVTLNGAGAFLGISKVHNTGELTDPAGVKESITYSGVTFSEDKNYMTLHIQYDPAGNTWQFKFAREGSDGASAPTTDSDGDGVADIDDACPELAGTEANGCPPSGVGTDPTDDFEGNGNITWTPDATTIDVNFANPSKSGINTSDTVLQYVDAGEDAQYANMNFDLNEAKTDKFDLTSKNIIKVKVFVPTPVAPIVTPKQISVKLQDGSSSAPWEGQVEKVVPYEYDVWQELTFDFSEFSAETKFSRVVVQFNGEDNYEAVTAYIDDFTYGAN